MHAIPWLEGGEDREFLIKRKGFYGKDSFKILYLARPPVPPSWRCGRGRQGAVDLGCLFPYPGSIADGSTPENACDMYHRYEEDLDCLASG